jgi:hypothetical protein
MAEQEADLETLLDEVRILLHLLLGILGNH